MYRTWLRYGLLVAIMLTTWTILTPGIEELQTLLILILVEVVAVALSAVAAYSFTKVDFTYGIATNSLGYIFLGVHICVGLTILGVYLVQFS